jgi:uncharacterized protein YggE
MTISAQLFIEILVLLVSFGTIYVALITRITKLEAKVEHIESTAEKAMMQLNTKLDKITDELADMRVMMEKKANRIDKP